MSRHTASNGPLACTSSTYSGQSEGHVSHNATSKTDSTISNLLCTMLGAIHLFRPLNGMNHPALLLRIFLLLAAAIRSPVHRHFQTDERPSPPRLKGMFCGCNCTIT